MTKFIVFIGLGTNIGNRTENLSTAIRLIKSNLGEIKEASPIYKTAAWGITNQPDFYNQVIQLSTTQYPFEVIETLLSIENKMGRVREKKWHERLIDLDILFYESIILTSENLKIPHPFINERVFVLKPLHDLYPNFIHPIFKKEVSQLLNECNDTTQIALA